MDQCILPTMTYSCQTWSLNKQATNKLRTAQRAMERKMLDLKLKDKIPCTEIRKRTKIIDTIEYTLKQKWKWAGHIARLKDNRWTKRCTEWQPRRGKRSRGRPSRRWQDDITEKEGTTWIKKATDRRQWKTLMEGYILVDGQSLDEDEDEPLCFHTLICSSDRSPSPADFQWPFRCLVGSRLIMYNTSELLDNGRGWCLLAFDQRWCVLVFDHEWCLLVYGHEWCFLVYVYEWCLLVHDQR